MREKTDFFLSKLYLIKTFKNLTTNFDIFYTQTSRHNKSAPPSWADYKGKRLGTNINALYTINNTKITFGGSMIKETYKDNTPFKKTRNNAALFLEVEHNINNLSIQAVARQDWFTTFGNHFTYKLGANYLVDKTGTILKINYSTGFRAPSIYELYAKPISKWSFLGGNKNLNPETAKTWDFGFLQGFQNNKITLSAVYFKSIIKDKITYTTNTETWESTYQNTPGKTIADGIELSIKAKPAKYIEFGANYTYTKSTNPQTGKQSARIPYRVYTGYITFKTLDDKILATGLSIFLYTPCLGILLKISSLLIIPLFFSLFDVFFLLFYLFSCNNSPNTPWGCTNSA